MTQKLLSFTKHNLKFSRKEIGSEFDNVLLTLWTTISDAGNLRYRLPPSPDICKCEMGNLPILILVLTERFNKKRATAPFLTLDEPCPVGGFNFTKVKPMETLFKLNFGDESGCTCHIIANASPFMVGHSLIVPEPDNLFNQVLRKDSLEIAIKTMLASTDEYLCMGFNSLLAYASVNHLHFHLWYSTSKLFASTSAISSHETLKKYSRLSHHPVENFVFEFYSYDDFQTTLDRLWGVIEECHRLQIAHNLFGARNDDGVLRMVLWPRRSVYEAKACSRPSPQAGEQRLSFDVAVAELAGMLVVPCEDTRRQLLRSDLQKMYLGERLESERFFELETALTKKDT